MAIPNGVVTLVQQWQQLVQQRKMLEQAIKKLEADEAAMEAAIVVGMDMQGINSINLDGIGTVYKTVLQKVRLKQGAEGINQLCIEQINAFVKAVEEDRPLYDALLFQQRPLQRELLKLMEENPGKDYGVNVEEETEVRLRRS